jgi:hypothetical protein
VLRRIIRRRDDGKENMWNLDAKTSQEKRLGRKKEYFAIIDKNNVDFRFINY